MEWCFPPQPQFPELCGEHPLADTASEAVIKAEVFGVCQSPLSRLLSCSTARRLTMPRRRYTRRDNCESGDVRLQWDSHGGNELRALPVL
jgi:hypothetical protein